jgi:hypothetical protein
MIRLQGVYNIPQFRLSIVLIITHDPATLIRTDTARNRSA